MLYKVSLLCATSAIMSQETGATGADGEPSATGVTDATGGDA